MGVEKELKKEEISDLQEEKIPLYIFVFFLGVVVTLIPAIWYIRTLKEPTLHTRFVPNAVGYWKPSLVQMIDTPEKLEAVKSSGIVDRNIASLGGFVKLGRKGLVSVPGQEAKSPGYHLEYLGPQAKKEKTIGGYHFLPDTLFTLDPVTIHILRTKMDVKAWEKKNVSPKEFLSVGGGIICPKKAKCFVTAKSTLDTEYSKIIPFSEL